MKVSVIVPVYNAAATLKSSLDSIKAQTFRDFEVVFVDDCSTDCTPDILNDFVRNSGIPCKLLRQDVNCGVAAARNRALDSASGEFVAFVDADDTVNPQTLEKAVAAAGDTADIVGWDWKLGFQTNGRYMRQADYSTPLETLKALMGGTMRWNLWLFMVRRSMLVDGSIRFIDGANMGEDMMFMIKAFLAAGNVAQIHESLYAYNAVSESAISHRFSTERRAEVSRNVTEVEQTVRRSLYSAELEEYIDYLKLYVKLPLLMSADKCDYRLWYDWFHESNHAAVANKQLPLRTRMVQWLAAHRCWLCVRLYYVLVYKFVYGIIYR